MNRPKKESADVICQPLPYDITKQAGTLDNREKIVLNFLENLLPNSDVRDISEELQKTFIFDKLKSNTTRVKPKKGAYLSTKQRKLLGLKHIITQKSLKYKEIVPLNKLWLEYIKQAIGCTKFTALPTRPDNAHWEIIGQKLMKADLHGARITIIRSKCPSLIGVNGIILQDTRNTFRIIGKDDVVRTIPKEVVVIKIFLIGATIEFFGKELCFRPAERSVKKFKASHLPEL